VLYFLLAVFVLSIPVCAFVGLALAIGARRRLREVEDHWRRRVGELELRVRDLEAGPLAVEPPRRAPAPPVPAASPEPEPPPIPERAAPVVERQPELAEKVVALPELTELRAPGPSLEERIGGRWFNWVGILAILFGVAYAMKYSFEQGWVTPAMRFWGGLVLGIGLLAAGAVSDRRSYAVLARGFWGGGIGILFVVFFAGFKLLLVHGEPILTRPLAFGGMVLTVVTGALIAIRFDTRTTAALSAIGGYLTPVLLRTGVPDQVFLFTYLSILTGGLLFLGYWKGWGFLRLLTFTVVVAYFAGWWITEGAGAPWAMLLYPSCLFLFFATEILAWSVWRRVADASLSYVVLGLATTLHTLSGLRVLGDFFPAFTGAFLLLTSLYLVLGARLVARSHPEDRPLALCYGYAAGVLFLLAPAFEARLHGAWIPCAWALQGVGLFLGEEVSGARGHARAFGYAAFGFASVRLLAYDTPTTLANVIPYLPLWNVRAVVYAIVTASLAFGCWRSWRRESRGGARPEEHVVATALWIVTLALPAVLLSLELAQALDVYVTPRFHGATRAYENQSAHWMTLLWAAYATLVATVTGRRGILVLRTVALVFGAFVLLHYIVRGLADTYVTEATPLLNSRFAVTLALALCLAWCAREFRFLPARGAAHLFLLAGLSMEWVDLSHVRAIGGGAEWFGMSLLIAAYGTGLAARGSVGLRPLGAALVAGAAAKFLLLDLPFVAAPADALFLQIRFLAGASAAAACLFVAPRAWPTPLRLLGHLVIVTTLTAETLDLFARHAWIHDWFAVVGLWAAYGCGALHVGYARCRPHLRAIGLVLPWISLMSGLVFLPAGDRATRVLLNLRFVGLGVVALALLLAAGLYRRRAPGAPLLRSGKFVEDRSLAVPLSLAGHALVMLLLTMEAADHFHLAGNEEHMRQLSYSLIWAVYAIGMVIAGLVRRYRPVRLMALVVLVGTILKVFLFDLSFLENPYRILSFLALGAILVAVSFLYQKYRRVLA